VLVNEINELRSLTVGHLDTRMAGLILDAVWTKNQKPGFQPLPAWLLSKLSESAQGKRPSDHSLKVPTNPVEVLEKELKRAGINKLGPGGKVDFHSLRTTFVNLVLDSGASRGNGPGPS
jgi:integrase